MEDRERRSAVPRIGKVVTDDRKQVETVTDEKPANKGRYHL
jgi:hypothetical protein